MVRFTAMTQHGFRTSGEKLRTVRDEGSILRDAQISSTNVWHIKELLVKQNIYKMTELFYCLPLTLRIHLISFRHSLKTEGEGENKLQSSLKNVCCSGESKVMLKIIKIAYFQKEYLHS